MSEIMHLLARIEGGNLIINFYKSNIWIMKMIEATYIAGEEPFVLEKLKYFK